jgi:5-methyltetrahydrofolate--homocysteine methyltransferase
METEISSEHKKVAIGPDRPTILIGERINPTGRKKLAEALRADNLDLVCKEAASQIEAGADIIDVNVVVPGMDEAELLPRTIQALIEEIDAPISLDSENPKALAASLELIKGKPLVNSVNGQEKSLKDILPLAKAYGTSVVALTVDDRGIPTDADRRVAIAHRIVEAATTIGIPIEDIIVDCLATAVATDSQAGLATLTAVDRIRKELGVNQTLGASNISYGQPERAVLNRAFLSMAIAAGVTCPYVNAAKMLPSVLATDLILGRDPFSRRYLTSFRRRMHTSDAPG